VAYPDVLAEPGRCSERLQLTFTPLEGTVPEWSPDGSKILFHGIGDGKDQRVYLISAEGGAAKPASIGRGEEMKPNWSPDGASVMYSDFPFFPREPGKVAIHLLNLKTQKVDTLPRLEGYFGPNRSPDGRYAPGMALDGQRIMLFDFKTGELVKGWGLVRWSPDGLYLYYLRYGPGSTVMRVRLSDRQAEEVASLKGIRQARRLAGLEFGLTPEGGSDCAPGCWDAGDLLAGLGAAVTGSAPRGAEPSVPADNYGTSSELTSPRCRRAGESAEFLTYARSVLHGCVPRFVL
jgi:hypothetical protein